MSPSNASDPPANRFAEGSPYGNGSPYRDAKLYDNNDGGGYGGYDGYDDDDIENYSGKDGIMHGSATSSIRQKRRPCCSTRCKLCLCFLVVVVVVTVVVAATVGSYDRAKAAYEASHPAQYATLDAAPDDLATWCSTTDESSDEYNKCLYHCHFADCCEVPSDYHEPGVSCLDPTNADAETVCADYEYACGMLSNLDNSHNEADDAAYNTDGADGDGDADAKGQDGDAGDNGQDGDGGDNQDNADGDADNADGGDSGNADNGGDNADNGSDGGDNGDGNR